MLLEGTCTRTKGVFSAFLRQGKKTGLKCRKVLLEKALVGVQTSLELAKLSAACALIFSCSVYCRRAKLILTAASGCYLLFPEYL